jgi:pyruvate/2-oxoglutarate dehydrogenase complex dihydrolipoamide acyltransferase (E2) component
VNSYKEIEWPAYRSDIIDFLNLRKDQNHASAIFEVNITKASEIISGLSKHGSITNAMIAYLLWCYGQAVKKHPEMQATKKGKKLILFDDVDVTMIFEKSLPDGKKVPVPYIFRSVQNKTYTDLNTELTGLKDKDLSELSKRKKSAFFRALPEFARLLILKTLLQDPTRRKEALGTVALTTLGMTVRNRKFWPVPIGPYPCMISSGASYRRPGAGGEETVWCLTITFDHNLNDGAPAVRFGQSLITLLESGEGLKQ